MKYFLVFDFVFFGYLYLVGYALFFFIRPKWISNLWGGIWGPPLYGLAILCVGAGYVVGMGAPVRALNWLGLGLALSSLILLINRGGLKPGLPRKARVPVIMVGLACLLSAEAFLLPTLSRDGTFSAPFHLGVDVAGYGITANYLTTWNNRDSLEKELLYETGLENLEAAKLRNGESLNCKVEVASEFILKSHRWAYPALTAALTELFGFDSVYRVLCRALFPSVVVTFLLIFWFARDFSKGFLAPILIAACVLLNCNFLNVALEGQYAQVLSAPLFLFLLFTVVKQRQSAEPFSVRNLVQTSLSPALIIGALMVLYNEIVFVFGIFIVLVILLDFIMLHKGPAFSFIVFVATFTVVGLIIAWPLTIEWVGFLGKQLVGIRIGGFWQPHWANPAEIIGAANIYSEFSIFELARQPAPFTASIFISILLCALGFFSWREGKKIYDWPIICAGGLFPLIIFVKTFLFESILNYQYMKSYTMFLPFLTLWTFVFILNLTPRDSFGRQFKACFLACMFGLVLLNGLSYLYNGTKVRYLAQESFHESIQALDKLRDHAIWARQSDGFMINRPFLFGASRTGFIWLNKGAVRLVGHHGNDRIAVLLFRDQPNSLKRELLAPSGQMLFENDLLEIIDTTLHVKDVTDNRGISIDMDRLNKLAERFLSSRQL